MWWIVLKLIKGFNFELKCILNVQVKYAQWVIVYIREQYGEKIRL